MTDVWILGAGFSRSLGGPLLNDFFSSDIRHQVHRLPAAAKRGRQLDELTNLYWGGARSRRPSDVPAGRPWFDAEQFLATLDAACEGDSRAGDLVHAALEGAAQDFKVLRRDAREYIAFATDEFVPSHDDVRQRELWGPYRRWANGVVERREIVISFNYDRTVEVASGGRLPAAMPSAELELHGGPLLLKLHGSVSWWRGQGGPRFDETLSTEQMIENNLEPFIAAPGPGKLHATRNELRSLWDRAAVALRQADRVHVVGFRFPPSDTELRHQLLGALARTGDERRAAVRIVLGSDVGHPDVARLRYLFSRHTAANNVVAAPCWAQDYIDDGNF